MAIEINGKTDVKGAASGLYGSSKAIAIVGIKGAESPNLKPNIVTRISGTKQADDYFGGNKVVTEMVKNLILNQAKNNYGVLVDTTAVDLIEPGSEHDTARSEALATAYDKAFDQLMGNASIKLIILDTLDEKVLAKLKAHLDLAEKEQIRRYGVTAVPKTIIESSAIAEYIRKLDDKRIFVAGPHALAEDGSDADERLLATALASILSTKTDDPALPTCSCPVVGFGGVKETVMKSELTALTKAGCTVFIMEDGDMVPYRTVTSRTSVDDEESNVTIYSDATTVLIDDYVYDKVSSFIKSNYKRTKNVDRILDAIRGDINVILSETEQLEIIENFNPDLTSVIKDPNDIYGAIMDYTFDVVTPLYTITLTQHMKL